ncbi:MAG: hypothetical protein LC775_11050, partial [Acidobacteria bacterium]|nr:hypothetical protein [Acidobacteriota bacterium]
SDLALRDISLADDPCPSRRVDGDATPEPARTQARAPPPGAAPCASRTSRRPSRGTGARRQPKGSAARHRAPHRRA